MFLDGTNIQALQLEDGTTAYITHPSAISLFGEHTLDASGINLEQFTSQVISEQYGYFLYYLNAVQEC